MSNDNQVEEIVICISSRIQPSVVGVTLLDERILRSRLKHTLAFISVLAVYSLTETCETKEKEMFYAKLYFVLD